MQVLDSSFMKAFEGKNATIPVWFMRQAGRYLKEYQAIKVKHKIEEMFRTPELAAEITCQPIDILGVDAAILFADILTLPTAMGCAIHFDNKKGPIIEDYAGLSRIHDFKGLEFVAQTIELVNKRLDPSIPLIGFAGSPFTVLTYIIEGGSSVHFTGTIKFMQSQPDEYHGLMKLLTKNTIDYLNFQKEAGIKVFQLFDSWAGILRAADYARFVLPYVCEIFDALDLPSIYFVKNTNHLLALMDQCGADFLSVDHTVVLGHSKIIEKTKKGLQGNLYNGLLYADDDVLKKEVNDVLVGGAKHSKFIFNLSHGVFPNVDVQKLKKIVGWVHEFQISSR